MLIKICGLMSNTDVEVINAAKPDWAGFVIDAPFSHRSLSVAEAKNLSAHLESSIASVGVFSNSSVDAIADAAQTCGFDVVQLHSNQSENDISVLRWLLSERAPECKIWRAFKIRSEDDIAQAETSSADMVLLDGGAGEGKVFNWSLAKKMKRPFIAAGGLSAENIEEVAKEISPYAVDISSGVETNKLKDPEKILEVIRIARSL